MQTYNSFPPPRWADDVRPSSVPLMPSPRSYEPEPPLTASVTPIYDRLYSEFRQLFRALPGDRSNEEDLRFTGFGHFHPAEGTYTPTDSAYAPTGGAGRHRGFLALPPGRG